MIEALEPRIAPAVVTINAGLKTATWIDYDGDFVTMKWSSVVPPTFTTENSGLGLLVDRLDLTPANHSNASFSITVKTNPGGDGRVEFGRVEAVGVPLKSWLSPAVNIAEFDCGNGNVAVSSSLVMGALGAIPHSSFTGNGGNGESRLNGLSGILSIRGDIDAASLAAGGFKSLTIFGDVRGDSTGGSATPGLLELSTTGSGTILITGSVIGGDAANEGFLSIGDGFTSLTIKGSIIGGSFPSTGVVTIGGTKTITSISVLGSIIGGSAMDTGKLNVDSTNTVVGVNISGNIVGGTADTSGVVTTGPLTSFTLGGSLLGGSVQNTGDIKLQRAGTVTIKGSIYGGRETVATANNLIGTLSVTDNLRTLVVNGDVVGGTFGSGTQVGYNGAILVGKNLIGATIKGSLIGNPEHQAILLAGGAAPAMPADYNAIGRLTVLGSVSLGYIASGQTADFTSFAARIGNAENPDAGIGPVTVSGNWLHSSLNTGLNDAGSTGIDLSDTHSAGDPLRTAKLAAVIIKGHVLDNPTLPGVSGFAATKFTSLTVGGVLVFKTGDPNHSLDPFGLVDVFET